MATAEKGGMLARPSAVRQASPPKAPAARGGLAFQCNCCKALVSTECKCVFVSNPTAIEPQARSRAIVALATAERYLNRKGLARPNCVHPTWPLSSKQQMPQAQCLSQWGPRPL